MMRAKALLLSLLFGAAVTFVNWYHPPMLTELSAPLTGRLAFELDPLEPPYTIWSSTDYTMQPGDILVGLQEHGLWNPYPLIEVAGKRVEPTEFGAGEHIINYVYSVGDAESMSVSYVSEFYDTVTYAVKPYSYNELTINPTLLDRDAGYVYTSSLHERDIETSCEWYTRTLSCFGGEMPAYYQLERIKSQTRFTYRDYYRDTTMIIPVHYESFRDDILAGYDELMGIEGGCTTSTEYYIKTGRHVRKRSRMVPVKPIPYNGLPMIWTYE